MFQPCQTINVPIAPSASDPSPGFDVVALVPWSHKPGKLIAVDPLSVNVNSSPDMPPAARTISIFAPNVTGSPVVAIRSLDGTAWLTVQNIKPFVNSKASFDVVFNSLSGSSTGVLHAGVEIAFRRRCRCFYFGIFYFGILDAFSPVDVQPSLRQFCGRQFTTGDSRRTRQQQREFQRARSQGYTVLPATGTTPATLTVTTPDPNGVPSDHIGFLFNGSSGTKLPVSNAVGTVIINTNPPGGNVTVDGGTTTGRDFHWFSGQNHQVRPGPDFANQPNGLLRLTSWSDGQAVTARFNLATGGSTTIDTAPSGQSFQVDGTPYMSPRRSIGRPPSLTS